MPDFGFVGQSYLAPDPRQSAQVCMNWYPEIAQDKKAKTVTALLGCPGKDTILTLGTGPVRGGLVLPGNAEALVCSGNQIYLLTGTAPTNVLKSQLTSTLVGTISSFTGPVVFQDMGVANTVFIADGTPQGWTFNGEVITPIADPGFYGANRMAFVDGWGIFNKPNTPIFYTTPSPPYTTTPFDPTYYDLNDGTSDNLVTLIEDKRELLLVNEFAAQWWYDAGGQYFPFSRLDGATLQIGCAAAQSIALFADGVIWLARSRRGQNVVVKTTGFNYADVSTVAINDQIASYTVVSDALGWTYQEDGHEFYVLTFPTADVTWVYDGTTEMWHQRGYYDAVAGVWHRDRANCFLNFQNYRLVGDYQNGNLYALNRKTYTDGGGTPLVAWRRCPTVWDEADYDRVFQYQIQFDFTPGQATSTGQGSNPKIMLRWSDDGGQTWNGEVDVPLGLIGQTQRRAITYSLSESRGRVYEAKFSDPVNRDITGASLIAET